MALYTRHISQSEVHDVFVLTVQPWCHHEIQRIELEDSPPWQGQIDSIGRPGLIEEMLQYRLNVRKPCRYGGKANDNWLMLKIQGQ